MADSLYDDGNVIDFTTAILTHGREKARQMVRQEDRKLIDIAAEMLATEQHSMAFTYAGFCMTSLPHRALPDHETWQKKGNRITLLIEPGKLLIDGEQVQFGVPYGARARTILLYLQTQAVQNKSREVSIGNSLRDFMHRMGVSVGGKTVASMKEQARRLSACNLKFFWDNDHNTGFVRGGIVEGGMSFANTMASNLGRQRELWEDTIILDEKFYESLKNHAVPISEQAIRKLIDRSMSLDIYIWLAYRLRSLERPEKISWVSLFAQFGSGFGHQRHFQRPFKEALRYALAAYPEAKVAEIDGGIELRPSPSPIASIEFRSHRTITQG